MATAMSVSKVLKAAGGRPYSGYVVSRARGGFRASQLQGGLVWVRHTFGTETDHLSPERRAEIKAQMNDTYATDLAAAGFALEPRVAGAAVYVR